jgi:hypothetical protein
VVAEERVEMFVWAADDEEVTAETDRAPPLKSRLYDAYEMGASASASASRMMCVWYE